jgi:7-cyano-7-deazaguanine synthase in queuosine biosynthesis
MVDNLNMAVTQTSYLLIDDGRLPALAAVVSQSDKARALLWHVETDGPCSSRRRRCVERHAELLVAQPPVMTSACWGDAVESAPVLRDAQILIEAVAIARQHGCQRIVWPVQVGPEPDRVGTVVEIAASVAEIAELEAGSELGSITIDLPVMDLDDRQIVDMADDGGMPLDAFWPCEQGGETPCGTCGECRRWKSAFDTAGVPWPWAVVATA